MRVDRSRLFIVASLLSLLVCFAGGAVVITQYQRMTSCYDDRPPLRSMNLTIDKTQGQKLIEQLQKFADKHHFDFEVSPFSPTGDKFSVWMQREDVDIVVRSPFDPGEFKIDFYNNNCIHPTLTSDLESLVIDLKSFINEVPNSIITEVD